MKNYIILSLILFVLVSLFSLKSFGQNSNNKKEIFYLVNSLNPKKKIKLSGNYELSQEAIKSDSTMKEMKISLTGNINSISDSSLIYNISQEYISFDSDEGYHIVMNPRKYDKNKIIKVVDIPFQKVNSISYSTPTRQVLGGISNSAAILSAFTTLIVAPLVSINYGSGKFRQDRYYKFAGVGLFSFIVSLPIAALSSSKKYKISRNNQKGEDFWHLRAR
ncbi:hypothetical protein V9L05_16000 [Bernardetia sp. Wsw4-3y2]|uniref:hypothetical protein n=1 Tax=unclassified Bernardetia TaxID=2647129 RepID=UPI0030CCCF76